jgi:hypothetical protein
MSYGYMTASTRGAIEEVIGVAGTIRVAIPLLSPFPLPLNPPFVIPAFRPSKCLYRINPFFITYPSDHRWPVVTWVTSSTWIISKAATLSLSLARRKGKKVEIRTSTISRRLALKFRETNTIVASHEAKKRIENDRLSNNFGKKETLLSIRRWRPQYHLWNLGRTGLFSELERQTRGYTVGGSPACGINTYPPTIRRNVGGRQSRIRLKKHHQHLNKFRRYKEANHTKKKAQYQFGVGGPTWGG